MRSKKHAIFALILSIFMFGNAEVELGVFFGLISSLYFYRWWNHPQRQLLSALKNDSQKFNVLVPSSYPLHLEFLKFYSKFLRLSTQYPALKNTYRELVDSMWLRLSQESSAKEWKEIISQTDKKWPSPIDVKNILNKSLSKVNIETKIMNEAMAKSR